MRRILSAAPLLRARTCGVERPAVERDGAVVAVERVCAAERAVRGARIAESVQLEHAALDPRLRVLRLRIRRLAVQPQRLPRASVEALERRLGEQGVDRERIPGMSLCGQLRACGRD